MDLAAVMDELGDRLATIPDLQVYRYPPESVTPPTAVVTYPDAIDFDATYGRGMDTMTIPIVVVVGLTTEESARDAIAGFVAGSGASSIKALLEGGEGYTSFSSCRVTRVVFSTYLVNTTSYLAAAFAVNIAGKGTS